MREKVWVPKLIVYNGYIGYVHRKGSSTSDIDYMFVMNGVEIEKIIVVEDEKAKIKADKKFHYVLPRFSEISCDESRAQRWKAVVDGEIVLKEKCFKLRGDVNLVVTGDRSLKINRHAFDSFSKINLVLPKEMGLFLVQGDSILNEHFPYLLVAQKDTFLKLGKKVGATEISGCGDKSGVGYDFEIVVDQKHFYDRKTRTIEDVKTMPLQGVEQIKK